MVDDVKAVRRMVDGLRAHFLLVRDGHQELLGETPAQAAVRMLGVIDRLEARLLAVEGSAGVAGRLAQNALADLQMAAIRLGHPAARLGGVAAQAQAQAPKPPAAEANGKPKAAGEKPAAAGPLSADERRQYVGLISQTTTVYGLRAPAADGPGRWPIDPGLAHANAGG